jgi:signal transduction histidine kinase
MSSGELGALASSIERERETLLACWRKQVRALPSARHLDVPTLNDHVPALLDELIAALRSASEKTIPEAVLEGSPPIHGLQRQQAGFDIVEVVAEYNILRGCIHDFAEERSIALRGRSFHILNRVLDEAIAAAVQTFAAGQALEVQRRREEYLAFVAHDLRTPLSAISLATRVLAIKLQGWEADVDLVRMQGALERNVKRLESLVDKVLMENDHVRVDSGVKLERREFYLWPLVESVIRDLEPVAGAAGAKLVNVVPEELAAFADASVVRRIFQNLVSNAIKYAPRGEIVMGAKTVGTDGTVECWVADDGSGIPSDRLGVIFDKMESDPERDDGTGLGLAIVKTFVEAHGGAVTVESQEGVGSTFRFTLPRSDAVA